MTLFDHIEPAKKPGVPYQPSSETSKEGAESVRGIAASQEELYLRVVGASGAHGCTDPEAVENYNRSPEVIQGLLKPVAVNVINARRATAMAKGLVVPAEKRVNPNSGVRNNVYILKKYVGYSRPMKTETMKGSEG